MADNGSGASGAAHNNASIRSRALGSMPDVLRALSSYSTGERRAALAESAAAFEQGLVSRPHENGWVNLLARSFFSYSNDEFSPSRLAWEAAVRGLSVIGCCDIDNLGALREMLDAGDALGVRAVVSLETKCYVRSCAGRDLSYPGQNGFLRAFGLGFTSIPALDSAHGAFIAQLPEKSHARNRARIEKINPLLSPVCIHYEEDVLPLTPAGNPLPEHLATAYVRKAESAFPEKVDQAVFWSDVLGRPPQDVEALLGDLHAFGEAVWDKFRQFTEEERDPDNYPGAAEFFKAVAASGAIPCVFWQGGATAGEADPERFFDDALLWGARAAALTPDARWNIAGAEEKRASLARLERMMAAARERALPVVAGSFMDRPGQKFVDAFDAPELADYFRDFNDAAFWLHGHAALHRAAGIGLLSDWAKHVFGADRAAANAFFRDAGRAAAPGKSARRRIAGIGSDRAPQDILEALVPLKI